MPLDLKFLSTFAIDKNVYGIEFTLKLHRRPYELLFFFSRKSWSGCFVQSVFLLLADINTLLQEKKSSSPQQNCQILKIGTCAGCSHRSLLLHNDIDWEDLAAQWEDLCSTSTSAQNVFPQTGELGWKSGKLLC